MTKTYSKDILLKEFVQNAKVLPKIVKDDQEPFAIYNLEKLLKRGVHVRYFIFKNYHNLNNFGAWSVINYQNKSNAKFLAYLLRNCQIFSYGYNHNIHMGKHGLIDSVSKISAFDPDPTKTKTIENIASIYTSLNFGKEKTHRFTMKNFDDFKKLLLNKEVKL